MHTPAAGNASRSMDSIPLLAGKRGELSPFVWAIHKVYALTKLLHLSKYKKDCLPKGFISPLTSCV